MTSADSVSLDRIRMIRSLLLSRSVAALVVAVANLAVGAGEAVAEKLVRAAIFVSLSTSFSSQVAAMEPLAQA